MNVKETAYLAVKVLSVFVFIKFITYFMGLFSVINMILASDPTGPISIFTQIILYVAPVLLLLVLSMCLWLYADGISEWMVKGLEVKEKVLLNFDDLQSIAFSVVGVVIIADTLPLLFTAVLRGQLVDFQQMEQLISIGSQGLKLIIGIWLFLGSRGIAGFIQNSKNAGLKK